MLQLFADHPKKAFAIKTSSKLNAQYFARLLKQHGCRRIVIAPGSRNAPLIIALSNDPDYECYSVPDERAAAFTAMGMSLQEREPVAVICTSGSAAVNFYPAVVEACYQHLPLVVITADRPQELIDQGVGQTIRQEGIFHSHIVKEVNLLRDPGDLLSKNQNQRLINEALLMSKNGPVHINVPFDEPLYDTVEAFEEEARVIREAAPVAMEPDLTTFGEIWEQSEKIMLLTGFMQPSEALAKAMNELNGKSPYLILSETVSNLQAGHNIRSIDRLINTIAEEDKEKLRPDLLITMGGEVVSKMVKQFLQEYRPAQHWHLSATGEVRDTFQFLNGVIRADELSFFKAMGKRKYGDSQQAYRDYWIRKDGEKKRTHRECLEKMEFSDFKAFQRILEHLPENSVLHTANSASIRYSQLFDHQPDTQHYTNRGTSGIDGCTSTAIGHALTTDQVVTLITGDVAFLYDSNAFWNDRLPANLRVVILNNSGGNIFRIIKGPDKNESFERFQETVHNLNLEGVAAIYNLEFQSVDTQEGLLQALPGFYADKGGPKILEIKTPRTRNPEVLQGYFDYLRLG